MEEGNSQRDEKWKMRPAGERGRKKDFRFLTCRARSDAKPRRGYVSLIKGTMKLRLDKKFLRNPLRKYAFEAIVNDSPAVLLSRTFLHGLRFLS